jgi:hypothetical protein
MLWKIATGVCVAGIVAVGLLLWKRNASDVGTVSEQWLAEHRVDTP